MEELGRSVGSVVKVDWSVGWVKEKKGKKEGGKGNI